MRVVAAPLDADAPVRAQMIAVDTDPATQSAQPARGDDVAPLPLGSAPDSLTWCALTTETLPIGAIYDWALRPECGAVVLFSGTVRDHAEHRTGVTLIDYEAYEPQVVPRLHAIDAALREKYPTAGRVCILHRIGPLALSEASVVVAVSAPHRGEAFDAARFGIDALKATVPIWKREHWDGGTDWGLAATDITSVDAWPSASSTKAPSTATSSTVTPSTGTTRTATTGETSVPS
jgi:molybdopterin synthase catalytic subunit